MDTQEKPSQDVINSPDMVIIQGWQAIGKHFGRSARTARRYYDNYQMPIRYSRTGQPFAIKQELNAWMLKEADKQEKDLAKREQLQENASAMRFIKKHKHNFDKIASFLKLSGDEQ